jgi:acetyl-CoA C-acetyltransferase
MTDIVIVSAARTAVGKFGGSLAKIPRRSWAPS